jgi:hypothetical protein
MTGQANDRGGFSPQEDGPLNGEGIAESARVEPLGSAVSQLERRVAELEAQLARVQAGVGPLDVGAAPLQVLEVEPSLRQYAPMLASLPGACRRPGKRRLVIPIHLPKLVHLSSIFAGVADDMEGDAPVVTFVATTALERALIQSYVDMVHPRLPIDCEIISAEEMCEALCFTTLGKRLMDGRAEGTINVKKILGLFRSVLLGSEETICMDSDVLFLKAPSELFDRVALNYSTGKMVFLNSPIDITQEVVRQSSSRFFSDRDAARLAALYGENKFSWFFDAPYYPASEASAFLAHLCHVGGGLERALGQLTWHTFDHVLFANYLILRGDLEVVDARSTVRPNAITDDLTLQDIGAIKEKYDLLPAWAPLSSLVSAGDHALKDQFFVAIHADRLREP